MRQITAKQFRFVAYYLGEANGNATQAARLAGYALPEEQGRRLVRNSTIRARIDAQLAEAALSANEVLSRLSEIAMGSLEEFVAFDPNEADGGRYTLDLRTAKRKGKFHLLKKLKPGRNGIEIEIHDPLAALEKLARYHGLLKDRDPYDRLTDDQVIAALKRFIPTRDQAEPPAPGTGEAKP